MLQNIMLYAELFVSGSTSKAVLNKVIRRGNNDEQVELGELLMGDDDTDAKVPKALSELSAHTENVLLTIADVSYFLHRSLEQKVSQIIDEGNILPIFRESVNDYINVSFKDESIGLNNMVSDAIDNKISEIIGTINIEVIVDQVIASTIKGIMATLPSEMFKIVREVTGKEITGMFQDNTPAIMIDVGKVIWEAVPGIAERLINHEIEQIKSAFA